MWSVLRSLNSFGVAAIISLISLYVYFAIFISPFYGIISPITTAKIQNNNASCPTNSSKLVGIIQFLSSCVFWLEQASREDKKHTNNSRLKWWSLKTPNSKFAAIQKVSISPRT
jgi:predicted PurR-regulated permease PerM